MSRMECRETVPVQAAHRKFAEITARDQSQYIKPMCVKVLPLPTVALPEMKTLSFHHFNSFTH